MSIWDHMPQHHTELLLKYDEYIGTWAELVEGLYETTCGRPEVRSVLEQGGERAGLLSSAVMIALLVDGVRAWKVKPRLKAKLLVEVENSIVHESLSRIIGDDAERIASLEDVYRTVAASFREAYPLKPHSTDAEVYARCAALGAYVAERCYPKDDPAFETLAQGVAIGLAEADPVFQKLGLSTTVDGNTIFFKHPRFIVMQS